MPTINYKRDCILLKEAVVTNSVQVEFDIDVELEVHLMKMAEIAQEMNLAKLTMPVNTGVKFYSTDDWNEIDVSDIAFEVTPHTVTLSARRGIHWIRSEAIELQSIFSDLHPLDQYVAITALGDLVDLGPHRSYDSAVSSLGDRDAVLIADKHKAAEWANALAQMLGAKLSF